MNNEQREIILRALVKFEGKWPDVSEDQDCLISSRGSGEIIASMINSSTIHEELDKARFDFVCTKSEFEAVLQELRDKAPEGAEYYSPCDGSFIECWFKFDEEWKFLTTNGTEWYRLNPLSIIADRQLIPLSKLTVPEKWQPEVGQECEATWGAKLAWHKLVIAGEFGFVLIGDYWQRKKVCDLDDIEFRPLHTEAEKERERLYDEISALDADLDDYQINRVIEFIQGRDDD